MFHVLLKQPPREKFISIYRQVQELHKKEWVIFKESFKTLERWQDEIFGELNWLDWTFYNFQIFVEMLDRFHKELKISNENRELILQSFDDLNLSFKMLCSGYYTSAGTHLRSFYEKNINWLHNHLTWRDERNCRTKVDEIFKHGQISYTKEPNLLKYPIHEDVVYKIYWFLSRHYVHKGINNLDIKFVRNDFVEGVVLTDICVHIIARFIHVAIGDDIDKKPIKERVLHQVDDYPYYFSYVQRLLGFGITTSPEVFFFNYVHDSTIARELILGKIGFRLEDLCSVSYLKSHRKYIR